MQRIGIRLTAGYDGEEVAVMLEAHRGDLRHNELPEGAITSTRCKARMRDVRLEVAESHADTPD